MFDHHRPHAFREERIHPEEAARAANRAMAAARARQARSPGLEAFAVHLNRDRTRVMTVEAWRDAAAYRADVDARAPGVALYTWVATGGRDPTPVADPAAGAIVIDLFRVPRLLVRPVSAFNARNGRSFYAQPGCVSTTVWRDGRTGRIATYARWRSVEDFAAAFATTTGRAARSPADVNRAAARMTLGLIRPDYHAYDLVHAEGVAS